jgi:hypothetical protein
MRRSKFQVIDGDGKLEGQRKSIFSDLEALRIVPDDNSQPLRVKVEEVEGPRPKAAFIMMPKVWCERLRAAQATGALWSLAAALLRRASFQARFPVTSGVLFEAGITRRHKRTFLEQLELAGLVKVEWRPAPQVSWITVLHSVSRRRRGE